MAGAVSVAGAWPLPLPWSDIHRGAAPLRLVAGPDTLALVARAIGAEAVTSLEADLTLRPWFDGVEIAGRVEAVVTRICGVTLEAFDERVTEPPLSVRVVTAGSPNAPQIQGRDLIVDPDAEDPPDELTGETLDIGAYVVEHLALALSPFPRKPDAIFEPSKAFDRPSPFAGLAALKPRSSED